jgi:sec-independent protein translocase protein TatC
MSFLNDLEQFGRKILSWLYLFLIAFIFFFAFGIKPIKFKFLIFNFQLPIPAPSFESISTLFFKKIQHDLLVKNAELIVTNPLDAMWTQIGISLFLAFVITLPFLLYKIAAYFSPALFKKEKRAILKALVSCLILFIGGCVFAYFFLIPETFKILYSYVSALGAKPFFAINQFISMVLILTGGVGIIFLLPIFMILLSRLGIVNPDAWKNNWRYAILTSFIIAAVITPDGTGITMILLALPITLLYFFGCIMSKKLWNQ